MTAYALSCYFPTLLDPSKPLTVPQMLNRSNGMHTRVLRAYLAGETTEAADWTTGPFRGARIVVVTLDRWGCSEDGKVTERGRQLIAAWETKYPRSAGRRDEGRRAP